MPDPGEEDARAACDVQAIGDQLVYRQAEGYEPSYAADRFRTGTVYGWNMALWLVAKKLGQEYEGKPYGKRIEEVPCPPGHDSFTWTPGSKHMGDYACECGATKRCLERNAEKAHNGHRYGQACKAMEGDHA